MLKKIVVALAVVLMSCSNPVKVQPKTNEGPYKVRIITAFSDSSSCIGINYNFTDTSIQGFDLCGRAIDSAIVNDSCLFIAVFQDHYDSMTVTKDTTWRPQ
jgi:hypothetical protein